MRIPTPGYETHTIAVAGQAVRVAIMGPRDAERTLLLFNGIGASLETVAPFAARFRRVRIVTFDVPGVGSSPTPSLPYRFTWLTRLAARVLDRLDIREVDVFGVSWGGAVAQQFVHDFPRRSRTLTLAATSAGFVMVPGSPKVIAKMATPKRYTNPDYMMAIGPDIYGGQLRFNRDILDHHAKAMRATTRRGYLYQMLAGVGWTSWLWLPQIRVPVLIMMGVDDPIVPLVNGSIMAARIRDARLVTMDCGHLFIMTYPDRTASLIESFLFDPASVASGDAGLAAA